MISTDTVQVALIGQPNVGKSSLFTRLTGVGVISSNYAGTTVEFEESTITRNGTTVNIRDLPGTYSLSKNSPDEDAAIKMLADSSNEAVIVVADATNMESSIVLCIEVMEMGFPTILALNKIDAARKKLDIDIDYLSRELGIPVMPVSARTAEGVDALADAVCAGAARRSGFRLKYGRGVSEAAESLSLAIESDTFDPFGMAVKMLEGTKDFIEMVPADIREEAARLRLTLNRLNSESPDVTIGRERYGVSDTIVRAAAKKTRTAPSLSDRLSDITINPVTGVPILLAVCGLVFFTIVYAGAFLDGIVSGLYDTYVGSRLADLAASLDPLAASVVTGINGSIGAMLSLVIPYIMVFYIMLGILEDSGYLPRAVVLLDRTMHRFGLHGGAFIPMIVGIGCNVPAILATRTIRSRRERLIAASMIVMAVPCSAQMAIIMGVTAKYAGIIYAFGILLMLVAVGCAVGLILNKVLRKEPSNLAMELPAFAVPMARNVLFKTWDRIKDFFVIAFPLLVAGSVIIELLLNYGMLAHLVEPMSFITVAMLGLPAVTVVAFIAGILRKEMAAALLAMLAGSVALDQFMTPEQFVVFGIVMAVYMPCLATITVMWREIGIKETILVMGVSVFTAIMLGTAANMLFSVF